MNTQVSLLKLAWVQLQLPGKKRHWTLGLANSHTRNIITMLAAHGGGGWYRQSRAAFKFILLLLLLLMLYSKSSQPSTSNVVVKPPDTALGSGSGITCSSHPPTLPPESDAATLINWTVSPKRKKITCLQLFVACECNRGHKTELSDGSYHDSGWSGDGT